MKPFIAIPLLVGVLGLSLAACSPQAPAKSIHQAASEGDVKSVKQHIKAGTNVNLQDKDRWAPLHIAAMAGQLEVVKVLMEAGADKNARGRFGKTPLVVAREGRHALVINYLQQGGGQTSGRGLVDGGLGVSEVLNLQ